MAEKMRTCDSCGEQWEASFFCDDCSRGGSWEIHEVPDLMWDGYPGKDYIEEEEWVPNGDICLNCCMDHTKPNNASTQTAGTLPPENQPVKSGVSSNEEIPF